MIGGSTGIVIAGGGGGGKGTYAVGSTSGGGGRAGPCSIRAAHRRKRPENGTRVDGGHWANTEVCLFVVGGVRE